MQSLRADHIRVSAHRVGDRVVERWLPRKAAHIDRELACAGVELKQRSQAGVILVRWMIYFLLTKKAGVIAAAQSAYASGSLLWDYATGIEIGIVNSLSVDGWSEVQLRVAR